MSEKLALADYHQLAPSREQRAELYIVDTLGPTALDAAQEIATDFKNETLPMARTAVLIPVAAHQESGLIFNTLREYAQQTTTEPFTVFLYLNTPFEESANPKVTESAVQINLARRTFPHLDVRMAFGEYEKPVIGEIRDDLWNGALLLAHHEGLLSGPDADVIGINNDIDTVRISPRYIENIQAYYRNRQQRINAINIPHAPVSPRGTKVKHAQPIDHPNIGKAVTWIDASYFQAHQYTSYEAGAVIPFSWFTFASGFDRSAQTYETSSILLGNAAPVIPNTLLETSPRRYVDRLGEHGLKGIWTPESFGANDACRNPQEKGDISHTQLEDIILENLSHTIEDLWLTPVIDAAFETDYDPHTQTPGEFAALVQHNTETKAARQLNLVGRYLRSVIGSNLLADMVQVDYTVKSVSEKYITAAYRAVDQFTVIIDSLEVGETEHAADNTPLEAESLRVKMNQALSALA